MKMYGVKSPDSMPIEGFEWTSDSVYKDTTGDERAKLALERHGVPDPDLIPMCRQMHQLGANCGTCTRAKGHKGNHLAGNGEAVIGAW